MSEENVKYSKDDILNTPVLEPTRHYESEGSFVAESEETTAIEEIPQQSLLLSVLQDIIDTYDICSLLPDTVKTILQNILNVLEEDTKRMIIDQLEEFYSPTLQSVIESAATPTVSVYDNTPTASTSDEDLFSSDPCIEVVSETPKTMISLAQSGYTKDSTDLKTYYTGKIQQMTHRYFQLMTTLAKDCNQTDYSTLLKDFDGESVTGIKDDSLHLRDAIVRSQVMREQKESLFQKTHTTDNTLILTRSWLSAEKTRERYLNESYKTADTLSSFYSNDLLLKNRNNADKNYTMALHNNYKYLNSSVIVSSEILDMQVEEAEAKSQLVKEGVNIFYSKAQEEKEAYEKSVQEAASKDMAVSSEDATAISNIQSGVVASGVSGSSSVSGSASVNSAVNLSPSEVQAQAWASAKKLGASTGIKAEFIYRQWSHESGDFTSRLAKENLNFGGLCQSTPNGEENKSPDSDLYYCMYSSVDEFANAYYNNYIKSYASDLAAAKTITEYATVLKNNGYYSAPLEVYINGMSSVSVPA